MVWVTGGDGGTYIYLGIQYSYNSTKGKGAFQDGGCNQIKVIITSIQNKNSAIYIFNKYYSSNILFKKLKQLRPGKLPPPK